MLDIQAACRNLQQPRRRPAYRGEWIALALLWNAAHLPLTLMAAEPVVSIKTTGGELMVGSLQEWTGHSLRIGSSVISATELVTIDFPAHRGVMASGHWLALTNGDRFAIHSPRIVDEHLQAQWTRAPLRPPLAIPLEFVSGIIWELPPVHTALYEQLALLSRRESGHDTINFLTGDDLHGELIGIDGGLIEFSAALGTSKLDLRRLRRVALDPDISAVPKTPGAGWVIQLTDGSRFTCERMEPRADGTLRLAPLVGDPFFVAVTEVLRLTRFDEKCQWLTSRKPLQVVYTPFLKGEQTLESNRNLYRRPLSLGLIERATGLGMTSLMSVSYVIEKGDERFHACIGIDDAAPETGSAGFEVLLDNKVVWTSPELRRHDSIEVPAVELKGHQLLTLRVNFGQAGDAGDLADWGDAVIIRVEQGE